MRAGSLVFFKKVTEHFDRVHLSSSAKRGTEFFGILLGQWNHKNPEPTPLDCVGILATTGWCKFDDIKESLGEAQMRKVLKHVEDKYRQKEETCKKSD